MLTSLLKLALGLFGTGILLLFILFLFVSGIWILVSPVGIVLICYGFSKILR